MLTTVEEAVLCNFEEELIVTEVPIYIKHLWTGEWENLITTSDVFVNILQHYNNKDFINDFLKNHQTDEVFVTGIACILCFVQENFVGPSLSTSLGDFLRGTSDNFNVNEYLTIDGEEINENVKYSELFAVAKYIFENCHFSNDSINSWWYLRLVLIYQHLLDELSSTLCANVEEKVNQLLEWELKPRLKAKLHLEISQFYLMYGRINDCEKYLNEVKELLKIDFELTGELGKRTKYQVKELAQIVLRLNMKDDNFDRPTIKNTTVPNIVKLDDDVRLDAVNFNKTIEITQLSNIEQAVILTTTQLMQKSRPKDEILLEESLAFLTNILQQTNSWPVRFTTLALRNSLESNHKRTIERSLTQCESLIANLSQNDPNTIDRIGLVWALSFHPKWKIESQLADLMLNLGLVKASLDIYLRLQMWEEVIVCYTIMELRHKAAEIIQNQIVKSPTVKLWCLLGDASDDVNCYKKAWELSELKSSRAQRHWGQFLFARKQYADCIEHLQKSLEINSLQNMVWLRLGYAALEVEDWKLAAHAYRRYTYLEPGGFEAWNNLAKAYVKFGDKNRAHYALQEALKFSFDNWKIWDNFMVVSAATEHFNDVIRAYHQILDQKEKHLDIEVLFMLVKHLLTHENEDNRLLTKARELFGRLTSLYPNESRLWELYSDLSPNSELKAQRLYRAYRGLVQDDWSKNPEKCGKVLEICKRLGEAGLEASTPTSLSSARLTLRSAVAAVKKQSWEQFEDTVQEVEGLLQKILSLSTS